jgi:hypothetical protein
MIFKNRKAVAMIELIFAIVIMGFALVSIPNLLALSANSGYTSLQQEAIATVSSDISLILSREWDESNTIKSIGKVILSTDGDSNLEVRDGGRTRVRGVIPIGASSDNSLKADKDSNNEDDNDDIDDANGKEVVLTAANTSSGTQTGNIDTSIKINTEVIYISDAENNGIWDSSSEVIYDYPINPTALSTRSNIKSIKTTLISDSTGVKELNKNIVMFAFSCNIGGYKIERKVLP